MPVMVTVLGLIVALFLGLFIGGSELAKLGFIFGLVGVIALISSMRQHIWLLVPIFWGFIGSVSILPLPFSVRDLVVLMVVGVSFALFALRVFKFRNKWDFLDLILAAEPCSDLPGVRSAPNRLKSAFLSNRWSKAILSMWPLPLSLISSYRIRLSRKRLHVDYQYSP